MKNHQIDGDLKGDFDVPLASQGVVGGAKCLVSRLKIGAHAEWRVEFVVSQTGEGPKYTPSLARAIRWYNEADVTGGESK